MKGNKAVLIVRVLMGLIFVVFGLNGFLQFLPMPPLQGGAGALMGGFMASGYMMPMIKLVEVIGGAMLLLNAWVPLALIILAPNIVNIFLFHAFLAPSGLPMAILLAAGECFLAYSYRKAYAPLLKKN